MINSTETVAAVSTPFGRGGIAVIRISGTDAVAVADKVFFPGSGKTLGQTESNRTVWGEIYSEGRVIDDGMATVFRAPHSFTGENTVELSCHGGILLTQRVLQAVFAAGAAPAGPGEFSKRAFCNGKLSLSEAEAVIDLIDAENDAQLRMAGSAARGRLTKAVEAIDARLRHAVSSTYAYIDFPDEDLEELSTEQLAREIAQAGRELDALLESHRGARAIRQGVRCAIVGKPNTGKSSLLNALSGGQHAIVTDVPGTTRDVIQQTVQAGRVALCLSDTAGIRHTDDAVEKIGVSRSLEALAEAELVLAVFDGSRPWDGEDDAVLEHLEKAHSPVVYLVNKSDLPREAVLPEQIAAQALEISAQTGAGKEQLVKRVERLFLDASIDYDTAAVVSNARQYAALATAREHVLRAEEALGQGFTQDIAGMDLELALGALGQVDGREVSEQIVDDIFHHFCVGK